MEISATAPYQVRNAALALAAVNELRQLDPCFRRITAGSAARGFAGASWPGRMEEALPEVYLDGAHNVSGIQAFLEGARELARGKAILLFSMVREKDYEKAVELLCQAGLWEELILTEIPQNPRALKLGCLEMVFTEQLENMGGQMPPVGQLVSHAGQMPPVEDAAGGVRILAVTDAGEALRLALSHKRPGQLVFCVGSLYLIGALKQEIDKLKQD